MVKSAKITTLFSLAIRTQHICTFRGLHIQCMMRNCVCISWVRVVTEHFRAGMSHYLACPCCWVFTSLSHHTNIVVHCLFHPSYVHCVIIHCIVVHCVVVQCIIDYCVVHRLLLSCRPSTLAPFISHCAFVHPHAAHQLSHRTLTLCCPSTIVLLSIKPLVDHRTNIHHDTVVDCTVAHWALGHSACDHCAIIHQSFPLSCCHPCTGASYPIYPIKIMVVVVEILYPHCYILSCY